MNGLYVRSSFDFAARRSIDNLRLEEWANALFGELNQPQPFRPYTVSLLGLEVLYRPGQRYLLRGNRKIALGSPYPDFTLRLQQGVPGLLGGMVGFTSLRFEVSDNWEHPRWGYTRWSAGAGGFLARNLDSIRFIEHKFFRGSDQALFSNPSNSLQALDSTYNTARPFLEFYGVHHFAHSPLDYVPLIKRLRATPVVGGGGRPRASVRVQPILFETSSNSFGRSFPSARRRACRSAASASIARSISAWRRWSSKIPQPARPRVPSRSPQRRKFMAVDYSARWKGLKRVHAPG